MSFRLNTIFVTKNNIIQKKIFNKELKTNLNYKNLNIIDYS